MSDADLRPPGSRGPRPLPPQLPTSTARWWEPLTTKWGLLGVLIFFGLVAGIWQSPKESTRSASENSLKPSADIGSQMSTLEQSCRKIENFAERLACEKPIQEWRAQKDEQRRIEQAKKDEQRRIGQAKYEEDRRKEEAYQAYRQVQTLRDGLKQSFVDMLSKGTRSFDDRRALENAIGDIAKLYDQNPSLRPPVTLRTYEISDELENVDVMPFENAATLIIQYAGQADERTVKKALGDLQLDRALKKPELIGVIEEGKNRRPYFPEVPRLSEPKNLGFIDKPMTPDELRLWQGRYQKWELQRAIIGIYRDCEEHFRPLYTQHIKTLFQHYISTHTRRVEAPPQGLPYPLYLLDSGTTPNERLGGALALLWEGQLTPLALRRINETPEALFANGCPADRRKFRLVNSNRVPAEIGAFRAEVLQEEARMEQRRQEDEARKKARR